MPIGKALVLLRNGMVVAQVVLVDRMVVVHVAHHVALTTFVD